MDNIVFNGQQTGERILAEIKPHPYPMIATIAKTGVVLLFFYVVLFSVAYLFNGLTGLIQVWSAVIVVLGLVIAVWWIMQTNTKSVIYLTDRRIMRFELLSPVYTAKRGLFWSEALKAKAFQTSLIWRMFKIGIVVVEPQQSASESIRVTDVFLFEDVANYIDKIIYLTKNNTEELNTLKPFIAKAKGYRS